MALGPTEIGGGLGAVLLGIVGRYVVPMVRDYFGHGDDPSLRQLVQAAATSAELAADNSKLLVTDVSALKTDMVAVKGRLEELETITGLRKNAR